MHGWQKFNAMLREGAGWLMNKTCKMVRAQLPNIIQLAVYVIFHKKFTKYERYWPLLSTILDRVFDRPNSSSELVEVVEEDGSLSDVDGDEKLGDDYVCTGVAGKEQQP